MAEIDVTVRVVIRDERGERMEYSRKVTDKNLTGNRSFWAQNAQMQGKKALDIVTTAVANEHGRPHP